MKESALNTRDLSLIAMMAAVLCILGPLSIPLPFSPVPISLTQLGIYLCAYLLGSRKGTAATALYVLLGAVGLPVFSGFSGGFAKLLGPTGGYILGFILMTFVAAAGIERFEGNIPALFICFVLANALCYTLGSIWLSVQMSTGLKEAFAIGTLPYIPADIIKTLFSMYACPVIRNAAQKRGFI